MAFDGSEGSIMSEVIFRQTRMTRNTSIIMAVLLPPGFFTYIAALELITGGTWEDVIELFSQPFTIVIFIPFLIFAGVLTYWALFAWKDQLVLTDTHVERKGLHHFRIYRGPVLYEDVVRVKRGLFGKVVIERE